jgi:hypothetical protein
MARGIPVGGTGRVAIAISPSNPSVAYVSIQDSFNGMGKDGQLLGIWRTSGAWAAAPAWTQIPNPDSDGL